MSQSSKPCAWAAVVAAAVVLYGLNTPLVEDALFWWVPQGLLASERGPMWVLDRLPQAVLPHDPLPPQWADGLPDYGHPPLWYWALGLAFWVMGPSHHAVHVLALPLAMMMAWGYARVLQELGGPRAAWAAMVLPLIPPVAAQLQNADTDLPLMALTPWALLGVLRRQEGLFAVCAVLATACKEPGVLLMVPALASNLADRRLGWGWLWPPMTLAAWAGVHHAETGWALAGTERLAPDLASWLGDLGSVLRVVAWEQGRWILPLLLLWGLLRARWRSRPLLILGLHLAVQLGFYGTINFLGGIAREDAHTHVRYLLSAVLALAVLGLALRARGAWLLLGFGLWHLHEASPDGPEASLWGLDLGRATQKAAPSLRALERPVWVGSYAWTQLTRPYAGVVDQPIPGLSLYQYGTDPDEVSGYVVETSSGEPLGRLQELDLRLVQEFRVHEAWLRVHQVQGRRDVSAPLTPHPEAGAASPPP